MSDVLRLTDPSTAREAGFVEQVKAALHLPADARLELQSAAQNAQGETVVTYAVTLPIQIGGAEFGAAGGVSVDERVIASLRFVHDALVSSEVSLIDERHLRLVKDQVRKLVAADEIYVASPGEAVDQAELIVRKQPYYIAYDEAGNKRIRRAFIACE